MSVQSIKEALTVLSGPWGIALLAAYVLAVVWAQTRSLIPLVFLHALVNAFSMAPDLAHKLIEGRAKRHL